MNEINEVERGKRMLDGGEESGDFEADFRDPTDQRSNSHH